VLVRQGEPGRRVIVLIKTRGRVPYNPESVPCPSDDALAEFLARECDAEQADAIRRHIADCSECAALVGDYADAFGLPTGSVLDLDALRHDGTTAGTGPSVGDTFGPYVVMGRLGRGGMGEVFEAYDPRLERNLALKVVAPGLSEAGAHALLQEARRAAALSHPNVVTVFDVGEACGCPYIAMELIRGPTLRQWLRTERSTQDVLRVFDQAAQGLQAAHDAGLVHRDFKPANVLIAEGEIAKVADFGLAVVAAEHESGSAAGTPGYMAPEQRRGGVVDARADQFAFAVALSQALGDDPTTAVDSVATEHQPRSGPALTRLDRRRARALRRALAAEPDDRFPSMGALTVALSKRRRWPAGLALLGGAALTVAWAAGEPPAIVPTCTVTSPIDPGRIERLQPDLELRSLVLAIDGVIAQRSTQYCEAQSHEANERVCLRRAEARLDAVLDALESDDAAAAQRARAILDAGTSEFIECDVSARPMPDDPTLDPFVERTRDAIEAARGHLTLGVLHRALDSLDHASALARTHGFAPVLAEIDAERGLVLGELGRFELADHHLTRAYHQAVELDDPELEAISAIRLARLRGVLNKRPDDATVWLRHAEAALERGGAVAQRVELRRVEGMVALQRFDHAGARDHFEAALAMRGAGEADGDERISLRASLGKALSGLDDLDEAGVVLSDTLADAIELYGDRHARVADLRNALAIVRDKQERPEHAESLYRASIESLSRDEIMHPKLLGAALRNLAILFISRGRPGEALEPLNQALAVLERTLGPAHLDVAEARGLLGDALVGLRRSAEAESHLLRSLDDLQSQLPSTDPRVIAAFSALATFERYRRDFRRAAAYAKTTMELQAKRDGARSLAVAGSLMELGNVVRELDEFDEAVDYLETGLAILDEHEGVRADDLRSGTLHNLALTLRDRGSLDEALGRVDESAMVARRLAGETSRRVYLLLITRSTIQLRADDPAGAEATLVEAEEIVNALDDEVERIFVQRLLAGAQERQGHRGRAAKTLAACEALAADNPLGERSLADAELWLSEA